MGAVWMRFRTDVRGRWPALLALTLLVAVAGGAALTAVAGARRTSTSFDRFRAESRSSDVFVNLGFADPDLVDEVRQLPQVEALAVIDTLAVQPADAETFVNMGASVDGRFGVDLDRSRVVAGRRAEPEAADEVTLSESVSDQLGLEVGDTLTLESYTPAQADRFRETEIELEPEGPTVALDVVGIERTPDELVGAGFESEGAIVLTPGFYRRYSGRIGSFAGLFLDVRLRGGAADVPAFSEAVRGINDDDAPLGFEPRSAPSAGAQDSLDVLTTGLLLFAVVAGLAGVVAVGQALGRQAFLAGVEHGPLRALGMTRRERVAVLVAPALPVALAGAALAVAAAVAASPLMPIGLARRAEPDPGVSVDGLVVGTGSAAVVVVVVALAALSSWRASRLTADVATPRESLRGRPRVAAAVGAAGLHPAVATGIRMALEPGRGRTAVPVRPALVGAALGILGVVATLVFSASLDRLVTTPRMYGWTWDVATGGPELEVEDVVADRAVSDVADAFLHSVLLDGEPVSGVGFEPVKGSLFLTVVEGREPRGPDEVVLGAETLDHFDRDIGDTVEAESPSGPRTLRIVGRAVFPIVSDPAVVADGAGFTGEGIAAFDDPDDQEGYHQILVRFAPGVDEAAAERRLARLAGESLTRPQLPPEIERLTQVDRLPFVLAAFLALLAALAVGHALVSAVDRRRRDLALLKTLGFVRGQVSATVACQASTLAVAGLVVGIPLGIVAGRWAWALVAGGLGVATDAAMPTLVLLAVIPAVLLIANAVAFLPGRVAARTRPAVVLRAE
jgi:hypothetical protein